MMKTDDYDQDQFDALYAGYVDDALTAQQGDQFQHLLKSSSKARQRFILLRQMKALTVVRHQREAVQSHEALENQSGQQDRPADWMLEENEAAVLNEPPRQSTRYAARAKPKKPVRYTFQQFQKIAALLLLTGGVFFAISQILFQDQRPFLMTSATDLNMNETEWSDQRHIEYGVPQMLSRGTARLRFVNSTTVSLSAPVRFVVKDDLTLNVTHGKAVIYVPDEARGFKVSTPTMDLIDQGTYFGVSVQEGRRTSLSVLKGAVEVQVNGTNEQQLLRTGESAENAIGQPLKQMPTDFKAYQSLLRSQFGVAGEQLEIVMDVTRIQSIAPDSGKLFLIPEKQNVRLKNKLSVDISKPSWVQHVNELTPGVIGKGEFVDSFLIKYQADSELVFSSTLSFQKPIRGIIVRHALMHRSGSQLSDVILDGNEDDMIELKGGGHVNTGDWIRLDPSRKKLEVTLRNISKNDTFRILF